MPASYAPNRYRVSMDAGVIGMITMQPPEKKTERVEVAPPPTEAAESQIVSKRADEILQAVEASTRSAGLAGEGSAPSDSTSGAGRATQTAVSSESPKEVSQADRPVGSSETLTGENWAELSASLDERKQEITAACLQAESVRDGLAEFAEALAAAGDAAQEKFGRLVESLETADTAFGPPGPLLRALGGRVDELAERAQRTVDDQLQRLTGLTVEYGRAADGLRGQVDAAIAGSRAAVSEMIAGRQRDLDEIRLVCEGMRDEVTELDAQVKITLGDDAKRRKTDHQAIQRAFEETTHQGCEKLTSYGQSVLDGLAQKLEDQVRATETSAQQQIQLIEQRTQGLEETYKTMADRVDLRERTLDEVTHQGREALTSLGQSLLDGLTDKLEEKIRRTSTIAQQTMETATAQVVESAQQRIQTFEAKARNIEGIHETIAGRLDLRERALEETIHRGLETLTHHGESLLAGLTEKLEEQVCRTATSAQQQMEAAGAQLIENTQQRIDEMQQRARDLEGTFETIAQRLDLREGAIEEAERRLRSLQAESDEGIRTLEERGKQGRTLADDLESELDTISAGAVKTIERHQNAARELDTQCASVQDRLTTAGNRMEHLTGLIERIEHANGQQQEQNHEARCLAEQLESAIQGARAAVNEQNQLVTETVAECDRTHQALKVALESGRRVDSQLVSLNQAGRQISAMVTGNITDAHAASDNLVATLQSATEERAAIDSQTRSTIDELRRAHEAGETAVELHERRIKHAIEGGLEFEKRTTGLQTDLAEKTEQAETAGKAAQQGAQLVERSVGGMRRLLQTLCTTAEKVRTLNQESQQQETNLGHAMESAAEMTDRQKAQWQLQQETTKTVTRQHDESRALIVELATAHDDASRSVKNVTEASAEAARALELLTELFSHVESRQKLFEDSQGLAQQFVDQATGIQDTLDKLRGRTQRLEQALGSALAAPKQVVADADAHAQQLGDVCKAVRKVFAGLSKVSLEAHERVNTFKELRTEVDERIEQLQTHTTTASETLRQWVTEAAHAQQRLAATLEHAPSIRATHPTGSLAALAGGQGDTAPGTGAATATVAPATSPIISKVKTPQPEGTIIHPTTEPVGVDSDNAAIQSADAGGTSSAIAKMIDEARRRCGIST